MTENIKYLFINLYGVLGLNKILHSKDTMLFQSNIQDGMGVTLALGAELKVVVVDNFHPAGLKRAQELKTSFQIQIDNNSRQNYFDFLEKYSIINNDVAWIASSSTVMDFYKKSSLKIAVPEAPEEILTSADYVTGNPGGKGALREAVEYIIKQQTDWDDFYKKFI